MVLRSRAPYAFLAVPDSSQAVFLAGDCAAMHVHMQDTTNQGAKRMNLKSALLYGAIAVCAPTFAQAQTDAATSATENSGTAIGHATVQRATSKAQRLANRELARQVRKQLFNTKGLKSTNITVFAMADTGKVVLAGFIDDAAQDQLAADAAKKVQGVNSVTSNLSIREEGS